jgi:enoyl-CoA hydratase/carnithine racemase
METDSTKEGRMHEIFNYNLINAALDKSTRSLTITLKEDDKNAFSAELLFELESLISWLTTRVEIHSVLIESENKTFLKSWEGLKSSINEKQIAKTREKVRKLSHSLWHLPQTIIIDLGKSANGLALDFSLGADIRLAHENTEMSFNQIEMGLAPTAGTLSQLSEIVPKAMAKNWILSGESIPPAQLTASGFVYKIYSNDNRDKQIKTLLFNIRGQAPVQRIQTKLAILEWSRENIEKNSQFEDSIHSASILNGDWKKVLDSKDESMKAKNFSYSVKKAQSSKLEKPTMSLVENSPKKINKYQLINGGKNDISNIEH